jgi:DNA-binding LytR/AlgR family response regulator
MPGGMSGAQLARIAKHEKPGMPVFIVTGTPSLVPDGHLADKVIAKPFKIEVIVKCLRDYGVV